ncbi:hypothetical protein [Pediococcus argentinicus]|nr:hypothetical protein [Pediococcus argentinicus]NKZ22864.1 hypothetical protein [Pediococcus argentinicus]
MNTEQAVIIKKKFERTVHMNRDNRLTIKVMAFVVAIFIIIGGGVFLIENNYQTHRFSYPHLKVKKWQADTKPLISKQEFQHDLQQVSRSNGSNISFDQIQSIVIPGLRGAWSINHKTQQPVLGRDWVPQGLAQNDKYFFVSAYDGKHKLDSVIFVISKSTEKYVRTIILPSKSHVGGITYDYQNKHLWVSNDHQKFAGLLMFNDHEIDSHNASAQKKPIKGKSFNLPWAAKTSGLNYFNYQLVVVKYGKDRNSRSVITMPFNKQGLPKQPSIAELKKIMNHHSSKQTIQGLIDDDLIQSMAPGYDRMQGLATTTRGLSIFSQSNGDANSNILVKVPNQNSGTQFDFFAPAGGVKTFQVPPAVEQISVNNPHDNRLALLFESGANKYRKQRSMYVGPYSMITDRIVILPIRER